jgi:hypothetical protein
VLRRETTRSRAHPPRRSRRRAGPA